MTIDEIFEHWNVDSIISRVDLAGAALDIPKLHNKYYRFFVNERLLLKKQEQDFAVLMLNKKAWCSGELTSSELKAFGWDVQLRKMLKSEAEDFLRADKDVIKTRLSMALQQEKIDALDSIIKMVSNRSFQISNAINFLKFQSGQ